ncbi:MAG: protein kinase [Clostridiaceae bacterium]|nr:protein kinase [Clostridiaceae bacterium]
MESKSAAEFLRGFADPYPPEFTRQYEAMECLSSGPSCETLLVRDRADGRLLVTKCYAPDHPLFSETEPDALHLLSHPGLPAFVGEFQNDHMRCILREYIPGNTLWEMKDGRPFSPEEVRAVGTGLCDILAFLHRCTPPVIHRDIKPQNVVIRDDGTVALIDLGITRLYVMGAAADTMCCGTPDFAPPEQYGYLQTDCRSDIYSLGILLSWMLTGKAEPLQSPKTPLAQVVAKCTAFSPNRRFGNAKTAKRALLNTRPETRVRRRAIYIAALFLLMLMVCGGFWLRDTLFPTNSGFTEPLIEEAVRMTLGKSADDPLSAEDLSTVTALYIEYNTACADMETFYRLHQTWCAQGALGRGPISSLRDLSLLPNLRVLCLAAEQIQDLSPLAKLSALEKIELRYNDVSDLTPLALLPLLREVGLNSNPVSDLSPLADCSTLRCLDLCSVPTDYDASVLAKLGDLDFLDISNRTDSYLYLDGKTIRELKISYRNLPNLSFLNGIKGLERLEIRSTGVSDLSELTRHPTLTYLSLNGLPISDFSPLLKLPALETVSADAGVRDQIEPIAAEGGFLVIYE